MERNFYAAYPFRIALFERLSTTAPTKHPAMPGPSSKSPGIPGFCTTPLSPLTKLHTQKHTRIGIAGLPPQRWQLLPACSRTQPLLRMVCAPKHGVSTSISILGDRPTFQS